MLSIRVFFLSVSEEAAEFFWFSFRSFQTESYKTKGEGECASEQQQETGLRNLTEQTDTGKTDERGRKKGKKKLCALIPLLRLCALSPPSSAFTPLSTLGSLNCLPTHPPFCCSPHLASPALTFPLCLSLVGCEGGS